MEEYSLNTYLEYFFSLYNPIFLAAMFFLLLFVVTYISYRYIYKPLMQKHRKEKDNLEIKNQKLLALFVELDPNPIVKIDVEGNIVGANNSANDRFNLDKSDKQKINVLLGNFDFSIRELISTNSSKMLSVVINQKYYEVNVHGISLLNLAQLYFYDVTENKEHMEQMNMYQKLLRESSSKSARELEQERTKLSALLHDSVGQDLLLLKLNFQNFKKHLVTNESQEEFMHTTDMIEFTIKDVKEVSRSIRPLNVDDLGLQTVLVSMCKNISRESHLDYNIDMPETRINLGIEYENCLYRIAQECLNNIIKHSKANSFSVNLSVDDSVVTMLISDDGIGFKPSTIFENKYISDGLGLINMQERVEKLNGNFHIDSSQNNGTVVLVSLPLNGKNIENERKYKNSSG